jgi:hypothetical protein
VPRPHRWPSWKWIAAEGRVPLVGAKKKAPTRGGRGLKSVNDEVWGVDSDTTMLTRLADSRKAPR